MPDETLRCTAFYLTTTQLLPKPKNNGERHCFKCESTAKFKQLFVLCLHSRIGCPTCGTHVQNRNATTGTSKTIIINLQLLIDINNYQMIQNTKEVSRTFKNQE